MNDKPRCFGSNSQLYSDYHDNEWGVPTYDDTTLFEFLILEGAQAGLNWETILKKRSGYHKAFHNFDPVKVANMSDNELDILKNNPDIIRNTLKIYSARKNAKAFLDIQSEYGSFSDYIWDYIDHKPIINNWPTIEDVPAQTPLSKTISKDLKKRGMSFVGPTIVYAYMQAIGMVNDHPQDCWKHHKKSEH